MTQSRRTVLASLLATAAAPLATSAPAFGASAGGYKALVCVFLYGGLDGHDVLLPYDASSYDQFARARASMIGSQPNRQRSRLTPLQLRDADRFGARQFALAPEMPNLARLVNRGQAAIIANVGPLLEPMTRARFESGGASLPPRLFSHNDQQSVWQASAPEGASFGWGGLFADAALRSGANTDQETFTAITSEGGLFLSGQLASPYRITPDGPSTIGFLEWLDEERRESPEADAAYRRLRDHFGARQYRGSNLIGRDLVNAMDGALTTSEEFNAARANAPGLSTSFPTGPLSAQLKAVAETIALRNALGVSRQVFFVGLGGFDTHDAQAQSLPASLAQIDGAVAAFQSAMTALGLDRDVTLFTASDFGRTLAVNGDGTDHGWGGHHLVVGGAVRGGAIYGDPPPPTFGHGQDAGGGRLIPTIGIEQYAAPLGRWFGLSDTDLQAALPNLGRFSIGPNFFA